MQYIDLIVNVCIVGNDAGERSEFRRDKTYELCPFSPLCAVLIFDRENKAEMPLINNADYSRNISLPKAYLSRGGALADATNRVSTKPN